MRYLYFILLLLSHQFYISLITGYAAIKPSMHDQLDFSQSFFGFGELMHMISQFLGSVVIILFPVSKINRFYFLCGLVQVMAFLIIVSGHWFTSLAKPLYVLGMSIYGAARAPGLFPYLILHSIFNRPEDVSCVNLWFGAADFGTFWGYFLQSWLLDTLNLNWTQSIMIQFGCYFVIFFLVYLVVPEVENQQEEDISVRMSLDILADHYKRKKSNPVLCVDFTLQQTFQYQFYYWTQYYFIMLKFGFGATLISFTMPLGTFLGSITLNPLLAKCPNITSMFTTICLLLIFLSSFSMLFFGSDPVDLPFYLIAFFIGQYVSMIPYAKSITNQLSQRTLNDRQNYLLVNFMRMTRELFTGIMMLTTGSLLDLNLRNFLYVYVITSFIILGVHILRRILESREGQQQALVERRQRKSSDQF